MIFQVDVPIFETVIICSHSCDAVTAMDEFYHWEGMKARIEIPEEDNKAGNVSIFKGGVFIWIKNPEDEYRFVFHELVHVFHAICEVKGIVNKDEEFEAYFMGWLKTNVSDRIMDHLDIKNNPVKLQVEEVQEQPVKKKLIRRKR